MINFTETDIEEIQVGRLKIKTSDLTVDDMPTQTMKDVFELCGSETAIKLLVYMPVSYTHLTLPTNREV